MKHTTAPPRETEPPLAKLSGCLMPYLAALIAAVAGGVSTQLLAGHVPATELTRVIGGAGALLGLLFLSWPALCAIVFGAGVGVIGATLGTPDAAFASAAIAAPISWLLARRF